MIWRSRKSAAAYLPDSLIRLWPWTKATLAALGPTELANHPLARPQTPSLASEKGVPEVKHF
jgi:hypothetical protein